MNVLRKVVSSIDGDDPYESMMIGVGGGELLL
jgi:hypothetical protein